MHQLNLALIDKYTFAVEEDAENCQNGKGLSKIDKHNSRGEV